MDGKTCICCWVRQNRPYIQTKANPDLSSLWTILGFDLTYLIISRVPIVYFESVLYISGFNKLPKILGPNK